MNLQCKLLCSFFLFFFNSKIFNLMEVTHVQQHLLCYWYTAEWLWSERNLNPGLKNVMFLNNDASNKFYHFIPGPSLTTEPQGSNMTSHSIPCRTYAKKSFRLLAYAAHRPCALHTMPMKLPRYIKMRRSIKATWDPAWTTPWCQSHEDSQHWKPLYTTQSIDKNDIFDGRGNVSTGLHL